MNVAKIAASALLVSGLYFAHPQYAAADQGMGSARAGGCQRQGINFQPVVQPVTETLGRTANTVYITLADRVETTVKTVTTAASGVARVIQSAGAQTTASVVKWGPMRLLFTR
jgi:hypothetical protein